MTQLGLALQKPHFWVAYPIHPEFVRHLFLPRIFLGTASGQIPAPGSFAGSAFSVPPKHTGPYHKAPARLGSSGLSLLIAPGKWGKKKEKNSCRTSTQ